MTSFLENLSLTWNNILEAEQVTTHWFLVTSSLPTLVFLFVYFLFIKLIAPNIWKEARNLKKTLIIYNILEITMNGWFIYKIFVSGWLTQNRPDLCGEAVNFNSSETNDLMAPVCWLFYLSKFFDLFDSFFLVMSKRFNDISNMKLFYDGYVLLSVWFVVRFLPGGHISIFMLLDTSTNALNHLYYLMSRSQLKANSKILLTLHFAQCLTLIMHSLELFLRNSCNVPALYILWIVTISVLHLVLVSRECKECWRKKETKNVKSDDYTGISVDSTTVTFNNYGYARDQSEVKKRYILKAQV